MEKYILIALKILIPVFFLIGAISISSKTDKKQIEFDKIEKEYFYNHKSELSGIVYDRVLLNHGYGVLFLKNVSSNIAEYDPFKNHERHFLCYIDDSICELYSFGASTINFNDSIILNTKMDSIYVYRDNKLNDNWRLGLITNGYYNEIVQIHNKRKSSVSSESQ